MFAVWFGDSVKKTGDKVERGRTEGVGLLHGMEKMETWLIIK